ncbi:7,8-didemethyl-8-hydroxy-5-deazariboflavin synthase, partial [Candidatus Bathyarchaeota archaeon]
MEADWLRNLSEKLSCGERLSQPEVSMLLKASDRLLPSLAAVSRRVKTSLRGNIVSYSRKVFIPLTRLCRNACDYCAFRLPEPKPGEIYLKPGQVLSIAEAGVKAGCFEALFTLGEKPEEKYPEAERELKALGYSSTIEYLYECCRMVYRRTGLLPHSNPGILSRE